MAYFLGMDVGSSTLKAGIFDAEGRTVAITTHSYPTDEPQPERREQDPEAWWRAAREGIREVVSGIPQGEILAVGITGYISSLTFVDRTGKPIRPAIGFQDRRAHREVDELYSLFTRQELAEYLGVDLPPAATWPLPRLLWLKRHEPATIEGAYRFLEAKDYLNLRLTGEFASDISSNRGIVNFSTGEPPANVFSTLGLETRLVPRLFAPHDIVGTVSREAAMETGLCPGTPVVAGWNDLNAAVLGSGAIYDGDAFNTSGTSEHIGVIASGNRSLPQLICSPFLPGRKLFYGVTSSGGGSLEWYRGLTGNSMEEALRLADAVPAGSESLLFLPYIEGERCPVWDLKASGAFLGIRTQHSQGHFVRAILEGVAFGLRQIWELVEGSYPANGNPITISGGGARAASWNQIKADVWGRATRAPENPHSGIVGAAILAAVAAGCYSNCEEAAKEMVKMSRRFEPHPARSGEYQSLYGLYCELYPTLRPLFGRFHSSYLQLRENHHK